MMSKFLGYTSLGLAIGYTLATSEYLSIDNSYRNDHTLGNYQFEWIALPQTEKRKASLTFTYSRTGGDTMMPIPANTYVHTV